MVKESTSNNISKDFVCIAIIGGNDEITRNIIKKELYKSNIVPYFEGSVTYSVLIDRKNASQALNILKNTNMLEGRWYQLVDKLE